MYDVQYPNRKEANDRARIVAKPDGVFTYRGILPTAYPIPDDGPIGDFLRAMGRHPHRSSHIHFLLTAPGYDEYVSLLSRSRGYIDVLFCTFSLTTALYPSHSPFLGTDPVFATKKSLVSEVRKEEDPKRWEEMGFKPGEVPNGRVWVWTYNFVLASEAEVAALKK